MVEWGEWKKGAAAKGSKKCWDVRGTQSDTFH